MSKSKIEWTDRTWNPVTGCTKVSPGCAHCYAERNTLRFKRGPAFLPGVTKITLHRDRLEAPLRWKKPALIFTCSMSDLFHEDVPSDFIYSVFQVMRMARRHTFQVLTKRPERFAEFNQLTIPRTPNAWLGVSVENQYWAERRIPPLLETDAPVKFLSVEPLLKAVDLREWLPYLDWVIVGGESGPRHRPMKPEWVRKIRDDCVAAGVSFFFKQWGGARPTSGGRLLDGEEWSEYPKNWYIYNYSKRLEARRG